jgi:hypothetical protein
MYVCLTVAALGLAAPLFGQFVYVTNDITNQDNGSISAFRMDPVTGDLTPVLASPFGLRYVASPNGLAVDPEWQVRLCGE